MGLSQKSDISVFVIPVLQLQFKQIPESHTNDSMRFRHSAITTAGMTKTILFRQPLQSFFIFKKFMPEYIILTFYRIFYNIGKINTTLNSFIRDN
jgi:hypothetical protein